MLLRTGHLGSSERGQQAGLRPGRGGHCKAGQVCGTNVLLRTQTLCIVDVKNENAVKYCVQKAGVSADILIHGPCSRVPEGPLLP